MKDSVDSIIEAIRSAFADVPRGDITIHEAEVIDDYGSDDERRKARGFDTEESWDQVPDHDIEECQDALCFLDPAGWRYYLPAYMIWSLRNFRVNDSVVSAFTVYTFDLSVDDAVRQHELERFRLLNEAQSLAVCRFLRYMAANDGYADARVARLALDKFWDRTCEQTDDFPEYGDAEPD